MSMLEMLYDVVEKLVADVAYSKPVVRCPAIAAIVNWIIICLNGTFGQRTLPSMTSALLEQTAGV
jgi:hypothetical protein